MTLRVRLLNSLSSSAMYFCTGVADEEMAFMPSSELFCNFVEETFFVYWQRSDPRNAGSPVTTDEELVLIHQKLFKGWDHGSTPSSGR